MLHGRNVTSEFLGVEIVPAVVGTGVAGFSVFRLLGMKERLLVFMFGAVRRVIAGGPWKLSCGLELAGLL